MRLLIFTILIIGCQDKLIDSPYPNSEFDKVIAYKMKGMESEVVEQNKLSNNVDSKNEPLNKIQVEELLSILNAKSTYGGVPAKCFEPHLGFVFYNSDNRIVAHSTICLACNWMSATPKISEFAFSKKGENRISKLESEIFGE